MSLTAVAAFLRLYRFEDFVTYLGDQGRDAIIIRKIALLQHLPAIGASTSVGQIFLGPFYYYFIAPWLLLFRFNPVGLAYGVAFFSVLYVPVTYFITSYLVNRKTAILSTLLLVFSSTMVEFSRFSWNPNLLPFCTLLFFFALVRSFEKKGYVYFLLTGMFLSFAIQLHALSLLLLPLTVSVFAIKLYQERSDKRGIIRLLFGGFITAVSFFLFALPLVIFDLRHQFINTKSFLHLFSSQNPVEANKIVNLFDTFSSLNRFVFGIQLNSWFNTGLLIGIVLVFFIMIKKSGVIRYCFFFFLALLVGTSLYSGPKYVHYFGTIYPFYFIVIAYLLSQLLNQTAGKALVGLFFISYIGLNGFQYHFLWEHGSNQIRRAQNIARSISQRVGTAPYALTSLPSLSSESMYRYFLENWGKKPVDKDSLDKPDTLIVVCESDCKPIGDPQWDIAYFAPKTVALSWKIEGVTVYQLQH